jgi:hypothetical protein
MYHLMPGMNVVRASILESANPTECYWAGAPSSTGDFVMRVSSLSARFEQQGSITGKIRIYSFHMGCIAVSRLVSFRGGLRCYWAPRPVAKPAPRSTHWHNVSLMTHVTSYAREGCTPSFGFCTPSFGSSSSPESPLLMGTQDMSPSTLHAW